MAVECRACLQARNAVDSISSHMMELENSVHGTGKKVLNDIVCEHSANWQEEQKNKGTNLEERNESQIQKAVCGKADLWVISAHTGECSETQKQSR